MHKITSSEKYNLVLIVLLFVIPLISLNISYYFLYSIDEEWALKVQEKKAIQEAETLSSESDFALQIESNFAKFFDGINRIKGKKESFSTEQLEKLANKVFSRPFPAYNLYVFKHSLESSKTELLYYKGDLKSGRRCLCLAFEHLFNLNNDIKTDSVKYKNSESFAKTILGQYASVLSVAKDMRGITTLSEGIHKSSWFIWDYTYTDENRKEVLGSFFDCSQVSDHEVYGRLLALKNLRNRGAAGAFIPVYKDYGEACIPEPLNRSKTFMDWANSITIQDQKDLEKWLKESLPQRVPLGKYTGFCHLGRGASHIAVVLVKSIKGFEWPKWLISINILLLSILSLIIAVGISFKKWPQVSLTTRFTLSYILASVLPLSLLSVAAYGYMLDYENSVINQSRSELLSALKSFDYQKYVSVKKYKIAFTRALNDKRLIELINEKGIYDELAARRVVDIFEKDDKLPILGVKLLDECGEGAFLVGSAPTNINVEPVINSIIPSQVIVLRNKLIEENPDAESVMKPYESNQEEDLDSNTYESFTGTSLKNNLNKHFSVPIPRKNGSSGTTYHIFDFIRIDNKVKCMLCVVWDDKTIDDKVIQSAFDNYPLKENNPSFLAFRIKGQSLEYIGKKTRHSTEENLKKAEIIAKQTINSKKTDSYTEKDYLIVAMPSLNFSQSVFIGWISTFNIDKDITIRIIIFAFLIIVSFIVLWFCSKRSASVFLKPVSALRNALDEVSSGNLRVGFENQPNDELGQLSKEFSNMIDGLIERERLSKIISDQAMQAIEKRSNNLLNDTETFKGVALVSDIRNFTGTSEKYDPTIITDLLNEHFAEMTKVISENGGLIYKFIGDAIEAVFPENTDFKENALERAFKAGCMMIAKLATINKRREKVGLFQYKIGVGLCYGMMHSGTIGSLETRLDYAILGDPLKLAAKYEALSIQNPSFPIVFGQEIAKEIENKGFVAGRIDSKGQDFTVYTIDKIVNSNNETINFTNEETDKKTNNNEETENYSKFSLQVENKGINNNRWLNNCILILAAVIIILGTNTLFQTKLDSLKDKSQTECLRLKNQLECDELLKSAFETLCLDYYEDISKALIADNNIKSNIQIIEDISTEYEKNGKPISYYCCCLYKGDSYEIDQICSRGFSPETCQTVASLASILKKDKNNSLKEEKKEVVERLMGQLTDVHHIRAAHYRRSAIATIENKEMYIDTDKIYDKDHKNIVAYVLCGIPVETERNFSPKYYTLLANNHVSLALNIKDEWYFSDNFSEKEQAFIRSNHDKENLLKEKGYLRLVKENLTFYLITTDLASYYCSATEFNVYLLIIIITLYFLLGFLSRKILALWGTTVAVKLRTDIFSSAILPLLIVGFVSYLYVNENYKVQISETKSELNKLMDEVENRELFYQPLCQSFLRKLSRSPQIQEFVNKANNAKNENDQKEILKNLRVFLNNNILDSEFKKYYFKSIDPFFLIPEILVIGKNDWIAGVSKTKKDNNTEENNISNFATISAQAGRSIFLSKNSTGKINVNETKEGIIAEKVIEGYGSMFGSNFAAKVISFTNNLICISVTFSSAGIFISPLPSIENPDYLILAFIFFENEFRPHICNIKNDVVPYKQHITKGGNGKNLYCFYSPNDSVGEYFFYDNGDKDFNYNNTREDLKTVKELGLASSWINTSYLPISREIELYGPHFLEARKGNFVSDNIYAALGSEKPLHQVAQKNLIKFGSTIFLSIIMIYLIAQSIIFDLLEPIKQLVYGARSAAKGDYSYRTYFSRKDEFGTLCNSFNKMMKGLEEKQLMNSMVSKSALKVTSKSADSRSKKINAVLMYVAVPEFDKYMKSLSSNELFVKLREQVSIIAEIVTKNGGDIDKIMGEKMLIAFHLGDKTAKETAINAAKAAHLIETEPKLHFKVAVGVNYGQVISGYLGVGEKRDFTIIGDPVNVTARIASFAEKLDSNKCVVSEGVMSLIKSEIKTVEYGEVQFKGKALPAKVYRMV